MGVFSWLHYLTYAKKTKLVDFHYKSLKSWKINNSDLTQQFKFYRLTVAGVNNSVQVLQGTLVEGQEKKRELATTSLEFEYLHQKNWSKMPIGGDDMLSIPLVHAFTCFSLFVYICADFSFALIKGNITAQSRWRACSQEIIKCENWTWLHHTHNLLMTWSSTLTGSADNKLNQYTRILKERNYNTRRKQWTMKNQRELELPT